MLLLENIILAINSLLSNKMRALLTMLGIIIGIGSVIAIITVGDSLTLSVSENMQSMGANNVYVMLNSRKDAEEESSRIDGAKFGKLPSDSMYINDSDYITEDMIKEMIEKFPDDIYAINAQYWAGRGTANLGNNSASITLYGNSVGYFVTNKLEMLGGKMFSETDYSEQKNVAIVSDKLVNKLFDGNVNNALGKDVEISIDGKMQSFTIIGVYENQGMAMMGMDMSGGDNATTDLYVPLKTAMNFTHETSGYTNFQIITKVGTDAELLAKKVETFFEPYYANNRTYEIQAVTMGSMVSMLTDMLSTITLAISIVAGIALIVGGIGSVLFFAAKVSGKL